MSVTKAANGAGPRRAIWGLVNDGYALVAKTANLSHDDAFELCRVPDIGDPSAYLDHGVAYLHAPKWGHVFARYFTNAERDSAGRASLVYDVVALSDVDFATLGNDPFRALPELAPDRRPERFGELPLPVLTPRSVAEESLQLTELLESEDNATVSALLGALLAGDHVLCIAPGLRAEVIECLVLLLPPSLRAGLTFQTPTVEFPKYTPRLAVAERGHALLVERDWGVVLPRDAENPKLTEARSLGARLVALGRQGDRLRRAWSAAGSERPSSAISASELQAAVAGIVRLDLLHEGLRTGDLRRTVLVAARAETMDERLALTDAILEHATPELIATALADVVRGDQRGAWAAVQAVSIGFAHRRERQSKRFASFFTSLIDALRDVPRSVGDATAREVHVLLACAAASLDDLGRFLDVADTSLPWDSAWRDGSARWVKGRSKVARLFDALAAKGATYSDAIDGINALTGVLATTEGKARERVGAMGLALVRRALRERASLEPPDRIGALVDGLLQLWSATSPRSNAADTDDTERAVRRFLGVSGAPTGEPRRIAAELVTAVTDGQGDESAAELMGWVTAGLERAHAGAVGEMTVRTVAALLDEQRKIAPRAELASIVGRVLLHFAATDAAFVFRAAWLDVARQADDASRRELLVRALSWVARGYANGRFTIGAFTDACVVAGAEGAMIDVALAQLVAPHLAAAVRERGSATEVALLAATVTSVATPEAAEQLVEAILTAASDAVGDDVHMRRLALALHEVERVRDEDRYGEARATLRRVLARHTIGPGEERTLRTFLAVEDGTAIGKWLSRLPSLSPRSAATVADKR